MKNMTLIANAQKTVLTFCFLFIANLMQAQLDVDINLGKSEWYEDPKVWIGVAVFLLILAFIVRGRK